MHAAKRIEIIIEAIMEKRLTTALVGAEVTGFTVLPVSGGSGRSGLWTRDGQIGRSEGMVAVVCLVRPDRLDMLIDKVFPLLSRHIGVINITDAQVLRAERF
jgi:nitrogen regulatory protein PII